MDYDFSKLMIPIHKVKKNILDNFSNLTRYDEFTELTTLDKDKLIQFIVYCYDSAGLCLYHEDTIKRRHEAANLADFPKQGKNFDQDYLDVILWKNEIVNMMGLRYCRIQRSPDFTVLVNYEERLSRELKELEDNNIPEKAKDRKTILEMISILRRDIADLRTKLFLGDNSKAMLFELLEVIENEDLSILRPEGIAQRRTQKLKLLDYNYYED